MDIINFGHLKRTILYLAILIGALILQDLFISHITILGAKAMFMPAVIVAIAYFEGGFYAGIMGIIAGVLCDNALSSSYITCTVLLPLIGFFCGVLVQFALNRSFFSYLIISAAAIFLTALGLFLPLCVFSDNSFPAMMRTAIIQTIWSLVFAFPAWYVCRGTSRLSRKEQYE